MQISSKHENQQNTTLQSFVGGLNTSSPDEHIEATQLAECINMEVDSAGLLRTVKGTIDVCIPDNLIADLKGGAVDSINNVLIVYDKAGNAYALVDEKLEPIGVLSGDDEVVYQPWEDGLLLASGGLLQYAKYVDNDAYQLVDLTTSPDDSGGVYARSARVFVFDDEDNLKYSAIGSEGLKEDGTPDEEAWVQDINDPASALFTQIGYKVGGRIIGIVNMQNCAVIVKDNGKVFRLDNEYPNWDLKEITSNGYCQGKTSFTSLGNGVLLLGKGMLQAISPTDQAGNNPIQLVGEQIKKEIANLPLNTKIRFSPKLNQVWFITGSQWVLVLDCKTQTFYQRYFNGDVVDLADEYIIKKDRISKLSEMEEVMEDNGEPLYYKAKFKTEMGLKDILIKHVDLSVSPLVSFYGDADAVLKVSRINISFPQRHRSIDGIFKRTIGITKRAYAPASTNVGTNKNDVAFNNENVSQGKSLLYKKRQICRDHRIDVELEGSGFPFILNFISYDKVVV